MNSRVIPDTAFERVDTAAGAPRYRPDIDGLRAIAIVPVVLYHFGIAPFSGGFVGVDVFFVISGFLITGLIHGELASGTFTLARFYERRIRRIFPALFAVCFACALAGWWLLFPQDLQRMSESLEAAVVFGTNFLFKNAAGYFDVAAERKPLLHTWSLAIEEQFYLVFPAMLFALRRFSHRRQLAVIGCIFAISLALSIWHVHHTPVAAFYLPTDRAWELMTGALLALAPVQATLTRAIREGLSVIGLGLIAFAVIFYNRNTGFPGEAALVPCAGAALLIFSGGAGDSTIRRVIGSAVPVTIGLTSYSLYLWHWPILVFAKYALFRDLTGPEKFGLIALSAILAFLSLRYVEQPFRSKPRRLNRQAVFTLAAVASAVTLAMGFTLTRHGGWPERFPPNIQAILAKPEKSARICIGKPVMHFRRGKVCRFGEPAAAQPDFLYWGDSHSARLLPVIDAIALEKHRSGLYASYGACRPLLGVNNSRSPGCKGFTDRVVKLLQTSSVREVILHARWAKGATGTATDNEDGADDFLSDAQTPHGTIRTNTAVFNRGLTRLVAALAAQGKKVVIIASVPEIGWPVPETLARIALGHSSRDIRPTLQAYLQRQQPVITLLDTLHRRYDVTVLYPHTVLCAGGRCRVQQNGLPIYEDSHHLNTRGAALLTGLLRKIP